MSDLILPASLATELDAVNVLLGSINENPVSTLDPSPSTDVDKALGCLHEAMRDVQGRPGGWKWNRETAYPLVVPISGQVSLPINTLNCTRAYFIPQFTTDAQPFQMTVRGLQIYDSYNHTYLFTAGSTIYVDVVWFLEWSLCPQQALSVFTYEATKKFVGRVNPSSIPIQVNADDLKRAWAQLEQTEDNDDSAPNALYGNIDTATKIMGTGSMRRGRING